LGLETAPPSQSPGHEMQEERIDDVSPYYGSDISDVTSPEG